jgi:phosphoserine phosphatase
VFDLDRTLLPGSSLLALARSMCTRRLLSVQQLATALAADGPFRRRGATDEQVDRLRLTALRQVEGVETAVLSAVLDEVGKALAPQVLPGAHLLLRRHR